MMAEQLECDYLIIGAGAMGMAFLDELLYSTTDTTFIICDKFCRPGGHWVFAYDFVTLQQPGAFYGVASKPLGDARSLASHAEIVWYYEDVMKGFINTGRVQFLPQTEFVEKTQVEGGDKIKGDMLASLLNPKLKYDVKVNKKLVYANYLETHANIPSRKKPDYHVDEGIELVPINGLSRVRSPYDRYVIVGAGKTGVDGVLFLLKNKVDPDCITFIMPSERYLVNRDLMEVEALPTCIFNDMGKILQSENLEQLVDAWEKSGMLFRIHPVEAKFMAAVISSEDMKNIKGVKNIVRQGRVQGIFKDRIVFQNGHEEMVGGGKEKVLYVDASSCAEQRTKPKKVFEGRIITLQFTRLYQATFSGSILGAYESKYPDDDELKNNAIITVPNPQTMEDFIHHMKANAINDMNYMQHLGPEWVRNNRLNWNHHIPLDKYEGLLQMQMKFGPQVIQTLEKIASQVAEYKDGDGHNGPI